MKNQVKSEDGNSLLVQCLQRLEYCRRLLNDIDDSTFIHLCARNVCNPLSEADMIAMGIMNKATRIILPNVWLCRYKCYHVCNAEECTRAVDGTCPISGITFTHHMIQSSYDSTDSKTWNVNTYELADSSERIDPQFVIENGNRNRKRLLSDASANLFEPVSITTTTTTTTTTTLSVVPEKKKNRYLSRAEAQSRIESLVYSLLFDTALRQKAYAHECQQYELEREKYWKHYTDQCRSQHKVIDIIQQLIVDSNYQRTIPPPINVSVPPDENHQRMTYYVTFLLKIYDKARAELQRPKINVEALSMGTLYTMQHGLTIQSVQVLPVDSYLIQYLPRAHQLPQFQRSKRKLTKGKALLRELFSNRTQLPLPVIQHEVIEYGTNDQMATVFKPTAREWKLKH